MEHEEYPNVKDVFEETGLFLALCRHGFVLMMADMVQSGKLSKYALSVVQKMIETFGADLGLGYDIGCRFRTTLDNSPLGSKARENNHRCLVGAFHTTDFANPKTWPPMSLV